MIRCATSDDLWPLVDLAEKANAESNYGFGFDRKCAAEYLWQYICHEDADILLAGDIDGAAMLARSVEFSAVPLCYVAKFWMFSRGTGAARALLAGVSDWADGCSHIFVTATAGLDDRQQRMFENLLKKGGYRVAGPCMVK